MIYDDFSSQLVTIYVLVTTVFLFQNLEIGEHSILGFQDSKCGKDPGV